MFAHAYYQVLSFSIRVVIIRHYSTKFEVICSSLCFEKLISSQVGREKTFCIGIVIEFFHLIYWYFKNDYYAVIILNQFLHCCFYCSHFGHPTLFGSLSHSIVWEISNRIFYLIQKGMSPFFICHVWLSTQNFRIMPLSPTELVYLFLYYLSQALNI